MFSGHFLAAFKIRFSGEPQDDTESTSPDQVLRLVFALGRLGFTLVLLGSSLLGPGFSFWSLGFTLAGLPPKEIASKQRSLVFIIKYCPIRLHSFRTIPPTLRVKCWSPVLEPGDGFFLSKPGRALKHRDHTIHRSLKKHRSHITQPNSKINRNQTAKQKDIMQVTKNIKSQDTGNHKHRRNVKSHAKCRNHTNRKNPIIFTLAGLCFKLGGLVSETTCKKSFQKHHAIIDSQRFQKAAENLSNARNHRNQTNQTNT
jgi:hypothetical protein